MTTLIAVLFLLALYHLIYDSIISPSLRVGLRYDLFEQRDRLRLLKIKMKDDLDDKVFKSLDASINTSLHFLHKITISTIWQVTHELKNNHKLDKQIQQRIRVVNNYQNEDIVDISKRTRQYGLAALGINSGSYIIYALPLVPPILVIILLVLLVEMVVKFLKFAGIAFDKMAINLTEAVFDTQDRIAYMKRVLINALFTPEHTYTDLGIESRAEVDF